VKMMRKKVIAGNWKMNKLKADADQFMEQVVGKVPSDEQVEAIVCAPYLYLPSLVEKAKGSEVKVGAQNMHFE